MVVGTDSGLLSEVLVATNFDEITLFSDKISKCLPSTVTKGGIMILNFKVIE